MKIINFQEYSLLRITVLKSKDCHNGKIQIIKSKNPNFNKVEKTQKNHKPKEM